jgi:protein-tyrosine phosphatase
MRFVRFPDGTEVRAASLPDRVEHDSWRHFGLYMDEAWRPSWESYVIRWQDFGLPYSNAEAVDQILGTFTRAKAGQHVEVGCIGGLGRTGTVLACMAVLAGVVPNEAVAWVRQNYDRRAVENREQEQWVLRFAGEVKHRGYWDRGKY